MPYDIVGGDYYAIESLDENRYGFLLADMEGHGVAAGLYTIHLSNLWNKHYPLLDNPADFVATINNELHKVVDNESSFATAICGLIDANNGVLRLVGAGGPPPLIIKPNGDIERLFVSGLILGIMEDVPYEDQTAQLAPGDSLLLVSDGAFEIHNSEGELLDVDGFIRLLKKLDYPQTHLKMDLLEQELLKFSNEIRLQDDVTIIEIKFLG
jgi:serine phosphatase RsbU (regulator of sigma subunit)